MAKMSELDAALTELSNHTAALIDAVQSIRELLGTAVMPEPAKSYTIEEVRAVLLAKRKAGYRDEVKAMLITHGGERLTDVDPAEYPALMKEAEALGT